MSSGRQSNDVGMSRKKGKRGKNETIKSRKSAIMGNSRRELRAVEEA
jgi:hypothetical protein